MRILRQTHSKLIARSVPPQSQQLTMIRREERLDLATHQSPQNRTPAQAPPIAPHRVPTRSLKPAVQGRMASPTGMQPRKRAARRLNKHQTKTRIWRRNLPKRSAPKKLVPNLLTQRVKWRRRRPVLVSRSRAAAVRVASTVVTATTRSLGWAAMTASLAVPGATSSTVAPVMTGSTAARAMTSLMAAPVAMY